MDNTSKTLAQINSYIGSLEHKEKEQKLKKVTWTTSLIAVVFLTALLTLYAPFGDTFQLKQPLTESADTSDETSGDLTTNLIIDTLVVMDKPDLASIAPNPIEVSPKKPEILAEARHQSKREVRKTQAKPEENLLTKNVSSLSSETEKKIAPTNREDSPQGVMRSAKPSSIKQNSADHSSSTPIWEPDVDPKFPGGRAALSLFIQKNVSYPKIAPKARKEGTVYVRFVVDEWGTIKNAKVIKGLDESYDQEALNLIQKMPRWVPGKIQGRAVPTYKDLGIMYKMY